MNMEKDIVKMLEPHKAYLKDVENGVTPFRNTLHLIAVMLSDTIDLKFNEEEEALKKVLHEVVDLKDVSMD